MALPFIYLFLFFISFSFFTSIVCYTDGDEIFADTDSNETIHVTSHSAIDYSLNGPDLLREVTSDEMLLAGPPTPINESMY